MYYNFNIKKKFIVRLNYYMHVTFASIVVHVVQQWTQNKTATTLPQSYYYSRLMKQLIYKFCFHLYIYAIDEF